MRIPRGVSRFSRIMGAGALLAGALGLWSTQPASAAINVAGTRLSLSPRLFISSRPPRHRRFNF